MNDIFLVNIYARDADAVYTLTATHTVTAPLAVETTLDSSVAVLTVARIRPEFSEPALTNPYQKSYFLPVLQH